MTDTNCIGVRLFLYELIRFETEYKNNSLICGCQLLYCRACARHQAGMD